MRIFLTRKFQKNFEKLEKEAQRKIKLALKQIYTNPHKGKKLIGELEGEYSWRVGSFRIVYTIEKKDVWIETVRHRKESYR
jgi:mRNA-degrading endonuclease RelE of RelBE toxin-antitoxin system